MKRLFALTIAFFLALAMILIRFSGSLPIHAPGLPFSGSHMQKQQVVSRSEEKTSAVWVATAYNIDYPSSDNLTVSELKAEACAILDTAKDSGINTVYLQVRPACDALYKSDIFPWSAVLTGTCGQAPDDGFDPLKFWVKAAHKRGLRLEAWVNPYRICAGDNASAAFDSLPESSPAKQHPEWVIAYENGYYFDPGLPEVRQLITDGITEIVKNYRVDGIQFDDYFYPGADFADGQTYEAYNPEHKSLSSWRRENVNALVESVSETVHRNAKNKDCVFGISPSGIWKNGSGGKSGSRTRGFEHYSQSYADSLFWVKNGWVDYLCPQVYWSIGEENADFEEVTRWWSAQMSDSDTRLIIGLAAYKIGTDDSIAWQTDGIDEIARQLELCKALPDVDGVSLFSVRDLMQRSELTDCLSDALPYSND